MFEPLKGIFVIDDFVGGKSEIAGSAHPSPPDSEDFKLFLQLIFYFYLWPTIVDVSVKTITFRALHYLLYSAQHKYGWW